MSHFSAEPGYIRMLKNGDPFPPNLLLYSTIPIIDSHNNHPALVNFTPAMNYSIGQVQFMDCTLTLVPQTVVMDAQTQKVLSVEPDIRKTTSAWSSYTGAILSPGFSDLDWAPDPSNTTSGNLFIDLVRVFPNSTPIDILIFALVADVALMDAGLDCPLHPLGLQQGSQQPLCVIRRHVSQFPSGRMQ
jgi:hypothetical protein